MSADNRQQLEEDYSGVVAAARELLDLMELEHWCNACEATQQGDPEADWCPVSQHLNALRAALAAVGGRPMNYAALYANAVDEVAVATVELNEVYALVTDLRDDLRTATWQLNEAVSLLREARPSLAPDDPLGEEIDDGLPAIQAALEHCAKASK